MMRFKNLFSLLILFVLLLSFTFAQSSIPKLYVEKVNSVEGYLIDPVKIYFIEKIKEKRIGIAYSRDEADYIAEITIVSANSRRNFNWVILLLPLWPIVPVTTVEGDAIVAVRIFDKYGQEVFFEQAGSVKSGRWFFGDFVSESSIKKDAVIDCVNKLMVGLTLR
ncbi:MAG: hypothetical protein ACPLKX_07220 [Dictyoglomaceae bacterium]|nr:MAG: hypothetical protein C0196_03005 [Dictyoglomus turgidum]